MSSAEARQRFVMMLLAAAIAAQQLRALQEARIEDQAKLLELKRAMGQLSNEDIVDLANTMLDAGDSPLDDEMQTISVSVFGGGGKVNGKYLPLRSEQIEEALRLSEDPDTETGVN